jgi:preprotein translocase subunit YajC
MGDVLLVALLALPLIGLWLLMRGQQRRSQQAAELVASLRVGQDVITTSGLIGVIAALDDDTVTLLVAPGVELRFDRRAIGRVLDEDGPGPAGGAGPAT